MDIRIGDISIGPQHKPFIIAEMSGNHNQSLERAIKIVDAAADCGADAIKIQTYTPDTITLNVKREEFVIHDKNSPWSGRTLYELYGEAYTPWEWHKPIMDHAKKRGIVAFSSPFDESAVDFLEGLDVPAYKIASFENNHYPLIRKVAETGKPVIISTGVTAWADLEDLVGYLRQIRCDKFILLKCTSTYPASPENTNLLTMPYMKEVFNCPVGLSDHTMGIGVAVSAVALGACVIEKHFTLSRADGGVDSTFSLEPDELRALVVETERAWLSRGKIARDLSDTEKKSLQFKRSIYVSSFIAKGERITKENIRVVRPSNGIPPKYYEEVLGKTAAVDLLPGTPLAFDHLR